MLRRQMPLRHNPRSYHESGFSITIACWLRYEGGRDDDNWEAMSGHSKRQPRGSMNIFPHVGCRESPHIIYAIRNMPTTAWFGGGRICLSSASVSALAACCNSFHKQILWLLPDLTWTDRIHESSIIHFHFCLQKLTLSKIADFEMIRLLTNRDMLGCEIGPKFSF